MPPETSVISLCDDNEPGGSHELPSWLRGGLLVVILAGAALRVVYPGTTVFCDDQARACALAEDIAAGRWEVAGMINSGQFRNLPGFAYVLAAVWIAAPDPSALVYFTGAVNLLALGLAAYLISRLAGTTAAWWGTAFLAAGPWSIQYCRWIWAQDLLFPAAVLAHVALWQWLVRGRKWALLGVILALTLVLQIHLAGVALILAVALLCLWRRPRLALLPLAIGLAIAVASVLPYLCHGELAAPDEQRFGYRHFWRVVPAAAMSLSGLQWSLEFKGGYPAFAHSLGWRRWPYEAIMLVPVAIFVWATLLSIFNMWRQRRRQSASGLPPMSLITALVLLIPLSFSLLGLRTSPTYLPVWYPLPFVLIGWLIARAGHQRRILPVFLLGVLAVELAFFAEQLRYIRNQGGVPGSIIDRSYGPLRADIDALAARVSATEVWAAYDGPSPIMDDASAFLFRHAKWGGSSPGRVLIWYRPWSDQSAIEPLADDVEPPAEAFLVRPWDGAQQREGKLQRRP